MPLSIGGFLLLKVLNQLEAVLGSQPTDGTGAVDCKDDGTVPVQDESGCMQTLLFFMVIGTGKPDRAMASSSHATGKVNSSSRAVVAAASSESTEAATTCVAIISNFFRFF